MHKSGIIRVAKYNEWLCNIVHVRKKNGKMHVCVDYRDLNTATPNVRCEFELKCNLAVLVLLYIAHGPETAA
jgi:hypothetical protein